MPKAAETYSLYRTEHIARRILVFSALAFLPLLFFVLAQTPPKNPKAKLEKQRKSLEEELKVANKLLEDTRNQKEQSLAELKILQKQIALREELLRQLNMGIQETETEISKASDLIATLENDLGSLKQQYGKLVFSTYKATVGRGEMFYLLSAESLNQATARFRYFRELSAYHKSQVEMIRRTQSFLQRKRNELQNVKVEKETLVGQEKNENERLAETRKEKDVLFKKLKKNEARFQQTIKEKQMALAKINKEIEALVMKEVKAAGKSADILLPLSKEFAENKGKMPWPLPSGNGLISTQFGVVEDESGIQVNNNGIDITTPEGQVIRAVFEGKVSQVQSIPMFGKVVIIQHGAFFTVYAHLAHALVEPGTQVKKLQDIGIAKTDKATGETKVHFQIFQNKTPLNPEDWLVKKN